MEIKLKSTYKGTRILFADTAKKKRFIINSSIDILVSEGFQEIMIPVVQMQETFQSKNFLILFPILYIYIIYLYYEI